MLFRSLRGKWYEESKAIEAEERLHIVEKAAQIIKEDICAKPFELERYPTEVESSLNADVLPCTLTREHVRAQ